MEAVSAESEGASPSGRHRFRQVSRDEARQRSGPGLHPTRKSYNLSGSGYAGLGQKSNRHAKTFTTCGSLLMSAKITCPTVFICYMAEDVERAHELYRRLREAGADPWMDKEKLTLGAPWREALLRAVKQADAFVVCLRPGFDSAGYRQQEVAAALDAVKERPPGSAFIIPYILELCDLPSWCGDIHAGNYRSKPSEFADLLHAINQHCASSLTEGVWEIKYVLKRQHHNRLRHYINHFARRLHTVHQWNYYYYDAQGVILSNRAMVRLRFEAAPKTEHETEPELVRAILTFKTNASLQPDGTEVRPETDYDVTALCKSRLDVDGTPSGAVLDALVASFEPNKQTPQVLEHVWEQLKAEFAVQGIRSADNLVLQPQCKMENVRTVAEMPNDLVLELDKFTTDVGSSYELEVECHMADAVKRDEYVHLVFAALDIPVVCPTRDLGRYPPKIAMALCHAGLSPLEGQLALGKQNADELLQLSHQERCGVCRSLRIPSDSGAHPGQK